MERRAPERPAANGRGLEEGLGRSGETRVWGSPGIRFMLERREKCVALVYRPPVAFLVDELPTAGREQLVDWKGHRGGSWVRLVPHGPDGAMEKP